MRKDIPTMGNTRKEIIFLDEWVQVAWNAANKNRFTRLGYVYTRMGDLFLCHINDLSKGSGIMVRARCPICKKDRHVEYKSVFREGQQHTLCPSCSSIVDIQGAVFERLTVIEFDKIDEVGTKWWCECECGNLKSMSSQSLFSEKTKSCGCYNLELKRAMSGENHPLWNGGRISVVCEICGRKYKRRRNYTTNAILCSPKCVGQWLSENKSGENSPSWNPSLTAEERIVKRDYKEYREWVKAVLKKDQYICQICGTTEGIEAHHMYSYKHHPRYRLVVKYGLAMCNGCHTEFHVWNGGFKKKCIPSDIDRWLYETYKPPRK